MFSTKGLLCLLIVMGGVEVIKLMYLWYSGDYGEVRKMRIVVGAWSLMLLAGGYFE